MPVILGLIGIVVAAYFWANRARNARDMAVDIVDMANDVRLAARRFGFRRRADVHPAESVDDPAIAQAAIATAFLELNDLPTADQRQRLHIQLRSKLALDEDGATEMEVLGRWLLNECGGADAAIARMSRRLFKLGGTAEMEPLLDLLRGAVGEGGLSTAQKEALDDIKRALRVR